MLENDDYQWLFRKAPAMMTSIAANGTYVDVSNTFLERLGYEREQVLGRRPADFVTAESAERIETEFLPALRRTGKLDNKPIAFVTQQGETLDCVTNSILEHDPNGDFVRNIAIYTEVSDAARANLKYRNLYRSTPAMLHSVDGNGCVVTVTDHWLQKLGYKREEVIGRPISDFFTATDREKLSGKILREFINEGDFNNEERRVVSKDGQVLDLIVSAISRRDSAGNVDRMLIASKDVTERNRAERQLRNALVENARLREELEQERD